MPNKFWHSRGYLPHCDVPGLLQSITFRLADSLPDDVLLRLLQEDGDKLKRHRQIEKYLDAGHGACWLKQAAVADIVEDALLHGDGQRYRLLAWCVMPNHVHVLLETLDGYPIAKIVQSWKTYTAKQINQLLGRSGSVWMRDYFDRYIRDENHLTAILDYIHKNPVKAVLVLKPQDWLHSSARLHLINSIDCAQSSTGAPTSTSAITKKYNYNADVDVGAPANKSAPAKQNQNTPHG